MSAPGPIIITSQLETSLFFIWPSGDDCIQWSLTGPNSKPIFAPFEGCTSSSKVQRTGHFTVACRSALVATSSMHIL